MKRIKTFFIYAILIAIFWLFSDLLIYVAIHGTYSNIETKVYVNSPEITVLKSKATYVNGVVSGNIKNNTNSILNNKYLKIDFYSKRNTKLGTKYIKINNLQINDNVKFEMWYKFTDVNYATITVTDNVNNATEQEFLSEETKTSLIIGSLIILYFI